MAGSPRIIARPTTRSPAACRRARVPQGQAFRGAKEAPPLTAAAPRRRWKYAVGTEECSQRGSNKRMECKGRPDWRDAPLTKKAPSKPYDASRRLPPHPARTSEPLSDQAPLGGFVLEYGTLLMIARSSKSQTPWPEFWHLWTVIIPLPSITGKLVRGAVWRRHDGRRWIYERFVEFDSLGN